MIEFKDIAVRFGTHIVLTDVNFRINPGDRLGIVGPNGSGKSTLFRLILGETLPDHGSVTIGSAVSLGYIRQHLQPLNDAETLLEYALRGIPRFVELEHELHALEHQLASAKGPEQEQLLARLGKVQTEFESLGGYEIETRVKISLGGLGFKEQEFDQPFKTFSGGWQMRAELSRVLASKPNLMLLDEPSNYLDLTAIEWLQRFLRLYDGTLVLISHDRFLVRTLTTSTLEVDANTVTRYNGDLDFYMREREIRYTNLLAARERQEQRRDQLQRFVDRFKAQATKAAQAQSRVKMIERLEQEMVVLPKRSLAASNLRLPVAPHCGVASVQLQDVSFAYDARHKVLNAVDLSLARGDKVAIVGYNGMGKTTLMRLIAGHLEPDSGVVTLGHKVIIGYLSQEFSETMLPELTVFESAKRAAPDTTERELRAQLSSFGFSADDIAKTVEVLSGGEKIRLAFLRLFLAAPNLLLLDEPTTHLDLEGRTALERTIKEYNGTVCLVSHDIEFVRNTVSSIIEITPEGVRHYPGGYDYYCDKRDATNATAAMGTTQRTNAPVEEVLSDGTPLSSRELRQQRARERAKYQPQLRKLKGGVEKAESQIAKYEAELEALSAILFNPQEDTDFATTNRRLKYVQDQLDDWNERWEEAALALENLESEIKNNELKVN